MSTVYRAHPVPTYDPQLYHWCSGPPVPATNCRREPVDPTTATDPATVPTDQRCRAGGCRSGWADWRPDVGEGAA